MTGAIDTLSEPPAAASAPLARTRPFFWSVKRELWENRAVYLAAPIAAAVVVFGALLGHLVTRGAVQIRSQGELPFVMPAVLPYLIATVAILATSCITGVFYCLAALNTERRDRSVLFWKSLPVSDLTTVLSKAVVPAVIMPVVTLATIFAAQLVMLAMDAAAITAKGESLDLYMGRLPLGQVWLDLAYAFVLLVFWWAPLWSWLLLVSAWAKRMAFVWAVAPPLAICLVERMSLGTDFTWRMLKGRLLQGAEIGFTTPPVADRIALPWPDPLPFLASPGLWIGLVLAAGFLTGAVWLRRRREPI